MGRISPRTIVRGAFSWIAALMTAVLTDRGFKIAELNSQDVSVLASSLRMRPDVMIDWNSTDGLSGVAGVFPDTYSRAVAAQARYDSDSLTAIGNTHQIQAPSSASMSKIGRRFRQVLGWGDCVSHAPQWAADWSVPPCVRHLFHSVPLLGEKEPFHRPRSCEATRWDGARALAADSLQIRVEVAGGGWPLPSLGGLRRRFAGGISRRILRCIVFSGILDGV